MKKSTIILAAGALATVSAQAGSVVSDGVGMQQQSPMMASEQWPNLSAGTKELGVGGQINLDDSVEYDLNFSYGYFWRDNWEVGLAIDWQGESGDILQNTRFGLFTEYNFVNSTKFVPYAGVGASYAASGDAFDQTNNVRISGEEGFAFTGELGVKYFFQPQMAIYAGVNYSWSPDDVFGVADEIGDSLTQVEIGMRFYF
jgi:outer membrane autotransporter protein